MKFWDVFGLVLFTAILIVGIVYQLGTENFVR
jgi:hypothetical protein